MALRCLFFLLALLAWGCQTGGPVEVAGVPVSAELRLAADSQQFDYTGYLSKALQSDEVSLDLLLQFQTPDSTVAANHGAVLRAVLNKTGDVFFARRVSAMPERAKQQIWRCLHFGGLASLKDAGSNTAEALVPPHQIGQYTGLYVFDPAGQSTFRDCANANKRYLVVDETAGKLETSYRNLLKKPYPSQPVFANLTGYLTAYHGGTELPGNLDSFLVVQQLVEMAQKNFRNTCIPYDFWALGTEPFWHAQVSEAEGVIEFRGMDDEATSRYTFQPPVQLDSAKIYAGINEKTGDNIRISLLPGPCSDGMSERSFAWRAELSVNGKALKGCAFTYEARTSFE